MEVGRTYLIVNNRNRGRSKGVLGRLVGEYEKFYLFQTRYWKTCILKSSIKCGEYTVREKGVI